MLNKTKYIIGLSLCGLLLGMQSNVYAQEEQSVQKIEQQESTDSKVKVENSTILSTEQATTTKDSQVQKTQETSAVSEEASQESTQSVEQSQAETVQSNEALQSRMVTRAVGVAEVASAADFKLALNNPAISTIVFLGNINMTENLRVSRSLTIDGGGYRLNMGGFELNANLNGVNQLKLQNTFILTAEVNNKNPMFWSDIDGYQMTFENITYQGVRPLINNSKGTIILSGTNDFLKNNVWGDMSSLVNLFNAKDLKFTAGSSTKALKTTVADTLILEADAKVYLNSPPSMAVLTITNPNSKLTIGAGALLDVKYQYRGIYAEKTSIEIKHRGSLQVMKEGPEVYNNGSAVAISNLMVRSGGEFISLNPRGNSTGYGLEIFNSGEAYFEQGARFDISMHHSPIGSGDSKNLTASNIYIDKTNLDVWNESVTSSFEGLPDRNYTDLETYFTVSTKPISSSYYETITKIHNTSHPNPQQFKTEFQMNNIGRISNINYVAMPPALPDPEPELFAQDRTIKVGQVFYPREGVWAKDAAGKDISADITIKNAVNTNVPGNYAVTYKVVTNGKTLTKTVTITVTN